MHVNPYQFTATVILCIALWYIRRKKKQEEGPKLGPRFGGSAPSVQKVVKVKEPPEVVYMNIRTKILETSRESLGLPGEPGEANRMEPYGLVMEMGIADSAVMLACFANGDAGVYYQTGGGMKGGLAHESVRNAVKDLIALAEKALPKMSRAVSQPLPAAGRVRFFVLTPRGLATAETDREALDDPGNELGPLFVSGQEVVSQMREVQEQRRAEFESGASAPPPPVDAPPAPPSDPA